MPTLGGSSLLCQWCYSAPHTPPTGGGNNNNKYIPNIFAQLAFVIVDDGDTDLIIKMPGPLYIYT